MSMYNFINTFFGRNTQNDVTSLINSINVELGVNLNDRLNEVERFHNKVLTGREDRLENQFKNVISQIETKKEELNQVSKNYNANLKYLNTFGALDDYVSINRLLADKSSTLVLAILVSMPAVPSRARN